MAEPGPCASCGAENRLNARFCGDCGNPLSPEVSCGSCGTINPVGLRFCDNCGTALGAGARPSSDSTAPIAAGRGGGTAELVGGRYQVVRILGEGGRKRVYLADDLALHRQVALSTLKSTALDVTALARARREAEAMARLSDHPNIVPIYDIGEDAERLFLVSQYMSGGDLQQALAAAPHGRLDLDRAMRIARQVADALDHAHGKGIVHRDVKPANVWFSPDGSAKLGDFGLALALDDDRLTTEASLVGTAAYMSPEQGLGQPATSRSDLYSLGVMLYELVCGRLPFRGTESAVVISQHVNTPPVRPTQLVPEIPKALDALIVSLLAKLPASRPGSAAEVVRMLDAMLLASGSEHTPLGAKTAALEALIDTPLVGRDRELHELRTALDATLAGQSRSVLISGDNGSGKTRLANELDTYAELRGAEVLWARCSSAEGAPDCWPWIQAIRTHLRSVDDEQLRSELGSGAATLAALVPEIVGRLPDVVVAEEADPGRAKFRLFDAITVFLQNAARRRPLLIVVDTLHDADPTTVELLEHLATEVGRSPILMVGCVRENQGGDLGPLDESVARLSRLGQFTHLRLRPLDAADVRGLLEAIAGHPLHASVEVAFVEAITRESGGNPYYLQEIVRHLVETGVLYRDGNHWRSDARRIEDLAIPPSIRDAAQRQLERLPEACRELLSLAAVVGREFSLGRLAALADLSQDELVEVLTPALRGQIVIADTVDADSYAFSHDATRESLYRQLKPERRAQLHRRLGALLEEAYGDRPEGHLAELAHHFAEAASTGAAPEAIDYCWWAAERAVQVGMYGEAAGHLRRASSLLPLVEDDPARWCELHLSLGDALWHAGEEAEAKAVFRQTAEWCSEQGLWDAYARAVLGFGGGPGGLSVETSSTAELVGMLETALDRLPARDSALRVRLLARLAVELHYHAEAGGRDDLLSAEAVQMADRIGDPRGQALAAYSRQWATLGPDQPEERLAETDEIVRLAVAIGDRQMEFAGHHLRLVLLLQLADLRSVDAEIRACERIAGSLREPRFDWQVASFRAMRALTRGDFSAGAALAAQALEMGSRAGEQPLMVYGAQEAIVRWATGGLEELAPGVREFAASSPESAWPAAEAWLLAEIGDVAAGRARLAELRKVGLGRRRRDHNWLTGTALLGLASLLVGDAEAGAEVRELLASHLDDLVPVLAGAGSLGPAAGYAGFAAHAAGDLETALSDYQCAIDLEARLGHTFLNPMVRAHRARAFLARDGEGDTARARAEVIAGIQEAEANGSLAREHHLRALLDELDAGSNDEVLSSIVAVMRSVAVERPNLRTAAAPDGTVTLMFSDIESSTEINGRVGDQRWMEMLRAHNEIVRNSCREHDGFEVKSQGDGFMLAFASGRKAIACAIAIQHRLRDHRAQHQDHPLRVRIGLHTGEAIQEGSDFHGANVNFAARVAQTAQADQILVSSTLRDILAPTGEFEFGPDHQVELKGFAGTYRAYPVPWAEQQAAS